MHGIQYKNHGNLSNISKLAGYFLKTNFEFSFEKKKDTKYVFFLYLGVNGSGHCFGANMR